MLAWAQFAGSATERRGLSKQLTSRLRLFVILVAITTAIGVLYSYFLTRNLETGAGALMFRSGVDWLVGGSLVWGFELFFVQSHYGSGIRRLHFLTAIALKSAVTLVISVSVSILDSIVFENTFELSVIVEPEFLRLLPVIFAAIIVLHTGLQIVRIVGVRPFANFVLGKYIRPVREDKIFMFLDLAGSTALAERLGDIGAHRMITQFFFDLNEPILNHGGEVYRYVGDQVIVTWPLKGRENNAEAIRCCFAIADFVRKKAADYETQFDAVPSFRIGLHCGPVVISQIGDQKQEISYFGDTVNTTARIEQQCKALDCQLLVSGELLDRVALPDAYHAQKMGSVQLRGREQETDLFTLSRAA